VSFSVYSMTEKNTILGVHVSSGSAETLVRRGGITNHHMLIYSPSNISAKTYQNALICIEVGVLHQCRFFETQCTKHLFVASNIIIFWSSCLLHLRSFNFMAGYRCIHYYSSDSIQKFCQKSCFKLQQVYNVK